jgi:predicted DsbA family dithiol-disulfide isomerase
VKVNWTAFPLHPETPDEGRSLEELFAGRPIDVPEMMRHLKQTAAELGLPFGDRTMTYNSRLAQELSKWAADKGRENPFNRAVFQAYFSDGLNIGSPAVLVNLADSAGLSADEAGRIIESRKYRRAVDQDWDRAVHLGVTAVPTFMIRSNSLVGAQPTPVLERFLEENGALRNTPPP